MASLSHLSDLSIKLGVKAHCLAHQSYRTGIPYLYRQGRMSLELKYITKKDATKAKIEATINEATEQVNTYKRAIEFKDKTVKAYAMVFTGSECVYCGAQ